MAAINQTRPAGTTNIRTPLFILGIALALIAFLVMFAFGLLFANKASIGTQIKVVAASKDINAREPITPDMLTTTSMPQSAAPPGAFTQLSALASSFALVSIPKGQVISSNLVTSDTSRPTGPNSYIAEIPDGWVAFTLPTGELVGVGGYIAQGDWIDIIATVNTQQFSPARPRQVTRTIFTNVHVIRVGPASTVPRQGQAQGPTSSITVVMTLCDAQYVRWMISSSTLTYALLSYHDYNKTELKPDPSCPSTELAPVVGPAQVDQRWGFTKG
jgi:Flp pilus assembly protein CpaB